MWKKVFNRLLNQKSKHNYKPSILGILVGQICIFVGQMYLDFFCQYKTSILTCIFKYTENKVHFCEVHKN